MSNRKNINAIWVTRLSNGKPYQQVSADGEIIKVAFFPGDGGDGFGARINRADARLLAKRINQCLDGTKIDERSRIDRLQAQITAEEEFAKEEGK